MKIAIIGGGIAGASIALYLSQRGLNNITLFEKGESLVNGPPICHLHAGGNLYREIDQQQCLTLLKQSIDLLRFYPHAIDYRPTVIALPKTDPGSPEQLTERLLVLRSEYAKLIEQDPKNKVLGESKDYFCFYSLAQIMQLRQRDNVVHPKTNNEWMIPVAKHLDLDKLQFPLLLVQEYGLNLFRLAASVTLSLEKMQQCQLLFKHQVKNIQKLPAGWSIHYQSASGGSSDTFDYLINAAGFRSGEIDDLINVKRQRLVEFKAAYVTKWENCDATWPEIIFVGERGTPQGMAQFTPYAQGYFQLHGMTEDITLFKDGLVKSSPLSAQPKLPAHFIKKIERDWDDALVRQRSQRAIAHISQYIPEFSNATLGSKPLFGAQQIPGEDASLRASDTSFVGANYARCEVVKASSVLTAAKVIFGHIQTLNSPQYLMQTSTQDDIYLSAQDVTQLAQKLAHARGYPAALAQVNSNEIN
ncbi:hypothetical protein PCNPT3_04405 [Psychromonas sp. CNPT3]|uniref:FAD-dependent oxidoreductase n=1 Tax=Psychromonas sp. CNPT3 TaxID=314282 RepID=UPI00006E809F|nr:FAD-dependent oxidoreductase [Psychromonas sp. CNPT3]AGH80823.1 hypothetical protein PCNPT3_04405 [Psychromonas sp. CNPT3]